MFRCVSLEQLVRVDHRLCDMRKVTATVLRSPDDGFDALYAELG